MRSFVFSVLFYTGVLVAGLSGGVSEASAQTPALLDFVKPNEYGKMSVSPDGRYGAIPKITTDRYCLDRFDAAIGKSQICADKNKVLRTSTQLLIIDLVNGKIDQQLEIPVGSDVSCLKFVKKTRLLICLSTLKTLNYFARATGNAITISIGEDKDKFPRADLSLSRFSVNGGLFGSPFIFNHIDDENIVIRRNLNQLLKTSVYEDEDDVLESLDGKTIHFVVNENNIPIVKVTCSRNCKSIEIIHRKDENDDWKTIKEVRANKELGYITSLFFPAAVDPETGHIFVLSREDTDERVTLKLFDPVTKSFTKTVLSHPKHDISRLLFDPVDKTISAAVVRSDRVEYLFEDMSLKSHYDSIQSQIKPGESFEVLDNNVKGQRAIVYVMSPDKPGKYYIYNPATRELAFGMDRNAGLSGQLNSASQALMLTMRDGAKIEAYHYFPKDKPKGAPLIVMPHGGPHVRDYFDFNSSVQFYVSRGYQVVQMNFRGSTGYGAKHEAAGYGEWGGLMQDDVTDTVKYFHQNGYASPSNTCIVGYSYGGFAALYGGATTPELYACIVSGGGVADLVRSMRDDRVRLSKRTYLFLQQSMGDLREKDDLKDRSPTRMAENFEAPVLLIHGERDQTVPLLHSRRMKDALKDADKPVTFIELEEAWHNGWSMENEIIYLESIAAFLDEHIGPE